MKPHVAAILLQHSSPTLIVQEDDGFKAVPVAVPAEIDAQGLVAEIRRAALEAGVVINAVVLALPSDSCLAATIETEELHRGQRWSGMLYRLEEYLPKDAEQLTANFVTHETQALGVAIDTHDTLPLLEALDHEGIQVCALTPTALMAAQTAIRSQQIMNGHLLLLGQDSFDLFKVENNLPLRWTFGRHNGFDLPLQLTPWSQTLESLQEEPHSLLPGVWVVADDSSLVETSRETWRNWQAHAIVQEHHQLIGEEATRITDQGYAPIIDLRRGELAKGNLLQRIEAPLHIAVAAILILLCGVCGVSLWRGHQYAEMVHQVQQKQQDLFRQAFPEQRVPGGVLSRLRSEQRRLAAMSGQGEQLPNWSSSLGGLHRTLVSLANLASGKGASGREELRFRVLEIRLDREDLYLDGQARSHSDADRIAAQLRNQAAFVIEPPRTENLPDKGISFTLLGRPTPEVTPPPEAPEGIPTQQEASPTLPGVPEVQVDGGLVKGVAP